MVPHAALRIGNFASDVAVQDTGNGSLRLIVPTRGDPSISWIDWTGSKLSCTSGDEDFALCDEAHRLVYTHEDPSLAGSPVEPFSAYADSVQDFAVVSDLRTATVVLIDSPRGKPATLADQKESLSSPSWHRAERRDGVAGRAPGGIVYVGSRTENRMQTLMVGRPANYDPASGINSLPPERRLVLPRHRRWQHGRQQQRSEQGSARSFERHARHRLLAER